MIFFWAHALLLGLLEYGGVSQSFSPSDTLRDLSQGPGAPWNDSPGISSVKVPVQQQQEQICVLDEEQGSWHYLPHSHCI